jgi:hypothetical protein
VTSRTVCVQLRTFRLTLLMQVACPMRLGTGSARVCPPLRSAAPGPQYTARKKAAVQKKAPQKAAVRQRGKAGHANTREWDAHIAQQRGIFPR